MSNYKLTPSPIHQPKEFPAARRTKYERSPNHQVVPDSPKCNSTFEPQIEEKQ
jgi:hypothetical protein